MPTDVGRKFILSIALIGFYFGLLYFTQIMLDNFMVYSVVGPNEYTPDTLDLISHRMPHYLSIFFQLRFYWDSLALGLFVGVFLLVWTLLPSPQLIKLILGFIIVITYGGALLFQGKDAPMFAIFEFTSNKPSYFYNDRIMMIYGKSDVASLHFYHKNTDLLGKREKSLGLLNSRKTLSMEEVLEYYSIKNESSKSSKDANDN